MKFVRYGNLKPQFHDIKKIKDPNMHTPPVEYGIYAFPFGYMETFLLGGIGSGSVKNGRYRYLRDENGKKIKDTWENLLRVDDKPYRGKDGGEYYRQVPTEKYQKLFKDKKIDPSKITYELCPDYNEDLETEEDIDKVETYFLIENEPTKFNYDGDVWCHFQEVAKLSDIKKIIGEWILVDIKTYKKLLDKYTYKIKQEHCRYKNSWNKNHCSVSGYPKHFDQDEFEVYIEKVN